MFFFDFWFNTNLLSWNDLLVKFLLCVCVNFWLQIISITNFTFLIKLEGAFGTVLPPTYGQQKNAYDRTTKYSIDVET
jgi:hypothetical protein